MIKLCRKVYQSYWQAAKIYGLDKHTLIRHVQKYGTNDDRIFNSETYDHEFLRYYLPDNKQAANNLINHCYDKYMN